MYVLVTGGDVYYILGKCHVQRRQPMWLCLCERSLVLVRGRGCGHGHGGGCGSASIVGAWNVVFSFHFHPFSEILSWQKHVCVVCMVRSDDPFL